MYTYKIVAVDTVLAQVDNTYFLDVAVEFSKGEDAESQEFAFLRKFGYPLDSTKEAIVADLENHCATFASDDVVAANSAAHAEMMANAESLKEELLK